MSDNSKQLLKVPDVAARLGVHRRTVLNLIHSGELAAVSVGQGKLLPHYRVSEQALNDYLVARRVTPRVTS